MKELGTENCPGEGVMKEENFRTAGNPLTCGSVGTFGISEDNITGRRKKFINNPQNTCLTVSPRGEIAQALVSATSKQGPGREVRVACLG